MTEIKLVRSGFEPNYEAAVDYRDRAKLSTGGTDVMSHIAGQGVGFAAGKRYAESKLLPLLQGAWEHLSKPLPIAQRLVAEIERIEGAK